MTLDKTIKEKISKNGPMPFSQFMEMALYDPELGFYTRGGAGRKRDFITSPESGPLFGKLIAKAIDQWWVQLGRPKSFTFLEAGAASGTLARSILRSELDCQDAMEYIAVETSEMQRNNQPPEIKSIAEMPLHVENGIIFANELLDNLPFDIYESTDDGRWNEIRVGVENGNLTEILLTPMEDQPEFSLEKSGIRVPFQKAAQEWLEMAFSTLKNGRVVVIDYAVDQFPVPLEKNWLRTYRQHQQTSHPLLNPGTKDITCDVDISQLGYVRTPTSIQTQREWLLDLGIEKLVNEGKEYWLENAHEPDLLALEARSRITESEALLDKNGLGGFKVIEWEVKSSPQIAQCNT